MRFSLLKGTKIPIIKLGTPLTIIPFTNLTITQQPSSVTVYDGDTIAFGVSGVTVPTFNITYQWQIALNQSSTFNDINFATTRVIFLSTTTSLNNSLIRCRLSASNIRHPNFTSSASLSVKPLDVNISVIKNIQQLVEVIADRPFTVSCTASASNSTPVTIDWETLDFPYSGNYITVATDSPILSTLSISRNSVKRLRAKISARGSNPVYSNVAMLCAYVPNLSTNYISCSARIDRVECPPDGFFEPGGGGWDYGWNTKNSPLGYGTAPDGSQDARSIYTEFSNFTPRYVSWQFRDEYNPGRQFRMSVWARLLSGTNVNSGEIISVTKDGLSDRVSIPVNGNLTNEWKRFEVRWTVSPAAGSYNYPTVFLLDNITFGSHVALWGAELNILGNLPPTPPPPPLAPLSGNAVVTIFRLNI